MRILTKLFLLLAVLVIVPLAAVMIVFWQSAATFKDDLTTQIDLTGDLVANKSELALLRQVELTHLKIIQEKAGRLESFFQTIRAAVLHQSTLTRQFLTGEAPATAPFPILTADEVNRLRDNDETWRREVHRRQPYTMYHLVQGVDPEKAKPTLERLRQLGGTFHHFFHVIAGCETAYMGHRDGIIFGYPGGSRFSPTYDPRRRPWYTAAQEKRSIIWTPVYMDRGDSGLVVTCAGPVLSPDDGSVMAVVAMDVKLSALISELFSLGDLKVSRALLIDDQNLVRVSAHYVDGEPAFDQELVLAQPAVGSLAVPGLEEAFKKIIAGGETSGIIQSASEGEDASLFIHAVVRLQAFEGEGVLSPVDAGKPGVPGVPGPTGGRQDTWRYVLQVPLGPVVQPAQEIRSDVHGATDQMNAKLAEELTDTTVAAAGIAVLAVAIALALAYYAAGSATRPLVQMERVADQIAKGNLDQQVEVKSRDEIGELGQAINEMILGLKEREFIKKTFKRYVAASVVDELIKDPSKANLGGERKDLTIFFSDLSGFTTLSENIAADVLVPLLNEYLGAMTDAIFAQEGTLDKYIGDAIVAFWGAPLSREDDAVRACRTALLNLEKLTSLWPDWERRGLPKLNMRIGIHTGPVVVGNIGSDAQMNYTVVGDTANTASRLESANKFYGTRILIGEATRLAAGDAIVAREIDCIAVMGKRLVIRIFELVDMAGKVDARRLAAIRLFDEALSAYRRQQWDVAEKGFEQVIAAMGDDKASRVFLERIKTFRVSPPAADWDGSFAMTEK